MFVLLEELSTHTDPLGVMTVYNNTCTCVFSKCACLSIGTSDRLVVLGYEKHSNLADKLSWKSKSECFRTSEN